MATDIDESRLPTNVRPTHYDLSVRTDLEKKTFNGVVVIQCVVLASGLRPPANTTRPQPRRGA
jgi:hypothetical protein